MGDIVNKKHYVFIDQLRTIAILCVLLTHSMNYASKQLLTGRGGNYSIVLRLFGSVIECFTQMGVPLFLMISGYLMLGRNYDKKYLSKFIKRNLIPLIISFELWNFFSFFFSKKTDSPYSFKQWFNSALFLDKGLDYLWFMGMIIGLYLALPLLSLLVKSVETSEIKKYLLLLLCIGFLIISVIPAILRLDFFLSGSINTVNISLDYSAFGPSIFAFYLLFGYIVKFIFYKIKLWYCVLLFTVSQSCEILICYYCISKNMRWHGYTSSPFIYISTIFLFIIFCKTNKTLPAQLNKIIAAISSCSFGIYVFHVFPMKILNIISFYDYFQSVSLSIICTFIITFIVSIFGVKLLALLSYSRKYLLLIK